MSKLLLIIILYFSTVPAYCDQVVTEDGCLITLIEDNYRVVNPSTCPDKQLIAYLNCFDKNILPDNNKPIECK